MALQTIRGGIDGDGRNNDATSFLIGNLLGLLKRHCVLHNLSFPYPWVEPVIFEHDGVATGPMPSHQRQRLDLAQVLARKFCDEASRERDSFKNRMASNRLGQTTYQVPQADEI